MAKSYETRRFYKDSPSGVMGPIFVAFGVALLLGLLSGTVWILWNLIGIR